MGLDGRWRELSGCVTPCPEEMSWEFKDFEKDRLVKFLPLKSAAVFFILQAHQFEFLLAEILNTIRCAACWEIRVVLLA